MDLTGKQIIGPELSAAGKAVLRAVDPATGEELPVVFHHATPDELERAASLAVEALPALRAATGADKAGLLRAIAAELEALGDILVQRFHLESGLPLARGQAEVGRTAGQLRMFADLVEEGSWVDARIDRADPGRQPVPKPDTRLMLVPLGPVAVFCASNFPLAFSVAVVDTASALAAGCPVIAKGHHAHPGTAELAGRAIQRAVASCGFQPGTFSLLHGPGREVGLGLVEHPAVRAVGFTGSQAGGRALFDAAAARPTPIPVYAEMASINPVFLLPGALAERGAEIAAGLHGSVTLGTGQFCTNPGLLVLRAGDAADAFLDRLAELLAGTAPTPMLHAGIRAAYAEGLGRLDAAGVELVARGGDDPGPGGCHADAALLRTTARDFVERPALRREVFGPSTLAVLCEGDDELGAVARCFEGELSSTVHSAGTDLDDCPDLLPILEARAGRLVFDGFPTGVEVCPSMNHGGPYPATTDPHFTSVGTAAIYRFARPVCYQDCPEERLPAELRSDNPLGIWRLVDGELTRDPL